MRGTKLAVAAAAVVGVCSLGVAAFALDGTGDTNVVSDPAVTTEAPVTTATTGVVTTDPATDPTGTGAPETGAPTDGSTGVSTVDCPDGQTFANHGAYVSSVAHDPNRAPGDVQKAAQSECGKPLATSEPPDTTEPTEPETTEPETGEAPAPPSGNPGTAPGNSGSAPGHNK
jgi:hypothetical protein